MPLVIGTIAIGQFEVIRQHVLYGINTSTVKKQTQFKPLANLLVSQ